MIKIKIFDGAAGMFNVWAYVYRHDSHLYRIICGGLSGYYYMTINRTFVSA
jgi:hypothetical protein